MRCFFAISLPRPILDYLAGLSYEWQAQNQDIQLKWVEKENLHLTLQFLGDVELNRINEINKALREKIHFTPFVLSLGGLGVFPNLRTPHLLKCGLIDQQKELIHIHKQISRVVMDSDIAIDDKPFSSHITLGRMKFCPNGVKINNLTVEKLNFTVNVFQLGESTLTPEGPIYNTLYQYVAT